MKYFHYIAKIYHPESHKVCGTVASMAEVPNYFTPTEALDVCSDTVMQILMQNVQNGYAPEGAYMSIETFDLKGTDKREPGDITEHQHIMEHQAAEQQKQAMAAAEAADEEQRLQHLEYLIDNGIIERVDATSYSPEARERIYAAFKRQIDNSIVPALADAIPVPDGDCPHLHMDGLICLDCGRDFTEECSGKGVTISE